MHKIAHRINTIDQLKALPSEYGAEVDIRSNGNKLIIHHDPFLEGEDFEDWIKEFKHGMLILNVKEEGLEARLMQIMRDYDIQNYFFLDQSFPFLIKLANTGEKRLAVRVSEFESIDTALSLKGKVEWIWVDCFNKMPLSFDTAKTLQDAGFKLCFVSPELQGRMDKKQVIDFKNELVSKKINPDAVCTKYMDMWS